VQDTEPHPIAERATLIADWLRLEQAHGVGCRSAHALLSAFGSPGAIFRAGATALAAHVSAGQAQAVSAPVTPALTALVAATLAWLEQPGHHLITFHDPLYPPALAEIPDPPLLL